MSANTDFHAQMANQLEDWRANAGTPGENHPLLSIDLSQHADSTLANSVSQICQGIVGLFLSKDGGLDRIIRNHLDRVVWDNCKENWSNDLEDMGEHLKEEARLKIQAAILEHLSLAHTHPESSEMRDRVRSFSLLEDA